MPFASTWLRRAITTGTGTDPAVNRQKGYDYNYLEGESIYAGFASAATQPVAANADLSYPNKPVITFTGTAGYPVNDILLHSSDYSDPQNDAITAVQFRVGEISAPGIPLYDSTVPRIYEIEELWTSAEIATSVPASIADARPRRRIACGPYLPRPRPPQRRHRALELLERAAAIRHLHARCLDLCELAAHLRDQLQSRYSHRRRSGRARVEPVVE